MKFCAVKSAKVGGVYLKIILIIFVCILNVKCELKDDSSSTDKLLKQFVNGIATPSSSGSSGSNGSYYTVGGTISGMDGGKTITLANNLFEISVFVFNGPFAFPFSYENHSTYAVSITSQPSGQTCSLANQNGSIQGTNVTSVIVLCN
ncbi:hemagglutinin [Leptospira licerasiae]|uniref:hemagglutinin n=1 Tax=Leptospira licerasiae TaxID=447106 RepID=UPI001083CE02|nr:hemagglutinin [Leptospira licerasiae]TGM87914.1 hemagglutinin [Leptospira licerasiae]